MSEHRRLVILGSGPAGYTAAIYAARANLEPTLISGSVPGGQLTQTTDVDNWPGESPGLQGPQLMERMAEHCQRLGADLIVDHIDSAQIGERPFTLKGGDGEYSCDALIIATGSSAKYLGLDSEQRLLGRGVSACATCDGFFFRDKPVCVIGGGNTAVEEALYLSRLASRVTLVHRRDELRAEKTLQQRLFERRDQGAVEILWSHRLCEVLGDTEAGVSGARLANLVDGEERVIEVDGVFIAIGHNPNTGIFDGQLRLEGGYITVGAAPQDPATATSVDGVFAAGDVADPIYRQAITSAGSGCQAALDAERYLDSLDRLA